MSKRDLKKYLTELHKKQLEEQILELYEKFSAVKTYYDFVFNPKEETLLKECKIKISNEYFPQKIQERREGQRCGVPLPKNTSSISFFWALILL